MSPRNQITATTRVDARGRTVRRALAPTRERREGKGHVEIVMAFVSRAIKRYWSLVSARQIKSPSDSLEMRTASFLDSRTATTERSSLNAEHVDHHRFCTESANCP